jgi:hypothetical protein
MCEKENIEGYFSILLQSFCKFFIFYLKQKERKIEGAMSVE